MKYLLLALSLILAGCSSKPQSDVRYVCLNPAMIIQSIAIKPSSPGVTIHSGYIEIVTQEGVKVRLSRSLCMEVEGAPDEQGN